jgi:hypothetical protein
MRSNDKKTERLMSSLTKSVTVLFLLLISSITIHIYSQTATLDKTFGQNGRTIIPNTSAISFFDFDNQGNIISLGGTSTGNGWSHLTITKTNADGFLDSSF